MPKTKPNAIEVTSDELERIYLDSTISAVAECEFVTECFGGLPADDDGLRLFCERYLKLETEEEIKAAIARIKTEEIGERDLEDMGELKEKESYGVNVLRRDDYGPWLGSWMIKAALKVAASRMGLFQSKKGSKGDIAHLGRIEAYEDSKKQTKYPDRIHLYVDGGTPAETRFKKIMGSVSTPKGRMSIVHDSEYVEPGTKFAFVFRVPPKSYSVETIKQLFARIGQIGLGSVKALERGKFRVLKLWIQLSKAP